MAERLISEAAIAAARERLAPVGGLTSIKRVCREEPDLHSAVSSIASTALADVEGMPEEAHSAVYRAVWAASLLTLESYRLAYYRLWRDTELGRLLERLDPGVKDAAGGDGGSDDDPDGPGAAGVPS